MGRIIAFVYGVVVYIICLATFLYAMGFVGINDFDLFGLRQVYLNLQRKKYTSLEFNTPDPSQYVRHPFDLGWLFAFWAAPTLTATHLLFGLIMTAYRLWRTGNLLVAAQLEFVQL